MSKKFFLNKDMCYLDSILLYNNANNYLRIMNGEFSGIEKSHLVTGNLLLDTKEPSTFTEVKMDNDTIVECNDLKHTLVQIDRIHPTGNQLNGANDHTIKSNGLTAIVLYPKSSFIDNQGYIVRIFAAPAQTSELMHEGYNGYCGVFCYNSKQQNRIPCFMYQNSYSSDNRSFMIGVQAFDSNKSPVFATNGEASNITNLGFYVQRSPAYKSPSTNSKDLEEKSDINACPIGHIRINPLPIKCNVYEVV